MTGPGPRTPPAEADRHRRAPGPGTRLDHLANILTVLVAVAAIGLSIWQGYENREFYRLSVLPHLEPTEATWNSAARIDDEHFLLPSDMDSLYAVAYSVRNTGLGPAVLKNFLVYQGGNAIFDAAQSGGTYSLGEVKADLDRLSFPTLELTRGYSAGEMLEAGEIHHLITAAVHFATVEEGAFDRSVQDIILDDVLEKYSFVFCYCSIYGTDCDMAYLGSAPPAENVCRP